MYALIAAGWRSHEVHTWICLHGAGHGCTPVVATWRAFPLESIITHHLTSYHAPVSRHRCIMHVQEAQQAAKEAIAAARAEVAAAQAKLAAAKDALGEVDSRIEALTAQLKEAKARVRDEGRREDRGRDGMGRGNGGHGARRKRESETGTQQEAHHTRECS